MPQDCAEQSVGSGREVSLPDGSCPRNSANWPSSDGSADVSSDVSAAGSTDGVGEDVGAAEVGVSPLTLLEAMLFVGDRNNRPLTASQAAPLMRGVAPEEIPGLVDQLNARYAANGQPFEVISDGAGYRMVLKPAFEALRTVFTGRIREARLSQAALDVLAIVAYRQPVTAEEVTRLRGTSSSHLLAQLVRRRLLSIRRPDDRRQPVRYATSERFLELFGLKSLADLPQSEEP